jgi:hypothetical protein
VPTVAGSVTTVGVPWREGPGVRIDPEAGRPNLLLGPNRLTPGQTFPIPDVVEEPRGQAIWHRIWHGRRKTQCDRRD